MTRSTKMSSDLAPVRPALDQVLEARHRWTLDGSHVHVPTTHGERHQRVDLRIDGDDLVLTSVVLGPRRVNKSAKRRRELAVRAWHRNSATNLVTYGIDRRSRLVGEVRHAVADLDPEELDLYIAVLAAECDRFEYLLGGDDRG
jgi:hypothetical protein